MAFNKIAKLINTLQLRAVKQVKFSFDPFSENVRSIREVLYQLHFPRVLSTNQNVNLKVDVRSDRSEPVINIGFSDGQKLLFKTQHLTTLEILERIYKVCQDKDPKKGETPVVATKSLKKKK
ncbi:39S ribosomal protein L53, mitochondrial-like [Gigantopelta aegis]|uniref:39S ribosomal protein L53, mitochondrial-like n=1 Tax=Gigantopelta aegis TaxID=1735272 RepID=UPI001B887C2B|nr:39S ribosomal protein L53, mitochondrial-like [Gigantopelta aegis]